MQRLTRNLATSFSGLRPTAPLRRPGAVGPMTGAPPARRCDGHPLTRAEENERLYRYEREVKQSFDAIVPVLKRVSALQHEEDFEQRAQAIARESLGFELPQHILADAWVEQLDMRRLFAWCVFQAYRRFCDDFLIRDPLASDAADAFEAMLQSHGFHTFDITPCADGRLAHVLRYVLRLPHRAVRRKSYAGAMFDIEDNIQKWVETEMLRFREGRPNTADAPTRYLKAAVYHFSSVDPEHQGCAAHGSDTRRAAAAALRRLQAFQEAIENSFCCGASIDLLLIGVDTDTDAIRVHVPDPGGAIDLDCYVDALRLFDQTVDGPAATARERIDEEVRHACGQVTPGMVGLVAWLVTNNLSQIEYVRANHGDHYADTGHAERFIGAGVGFEEIQLRNLMYFAYLNTVEEAAGDLDVGVKIFSGLNVSHGLPIPVVVRFDYHGEVPGARERAVEHCARVTAALQARYPDLNRQGLLHTLQVVRDCHADALIEVVSSSVDAAPAGGHA